MERKLGAAVLMFVVFWSSPGLAEKINQGPFFYEKNGSYFQYFYDNRKGYWTNARKLANSKIYKGLRGRLAVIDSKDVHNFVMEKFKIDEEFWIGLRYWCAHKRLQWVGKGRSSNSKGPRGFQNWHSQWFRNPNITCMGSNISYMPVNYREIGGVWRWQASGPGKGFTGYLVEFPSKK